MIQTVCSEIGRNKVGISIRQGVFLGPAVRKSYLVRFSYHSVSYIEDCLWPVKGISYLLVRNRSIRWYAKKIVRKSARSPKGILRKAAAACCHARLCGKRV